MRERKNGYLYITPLIFDINFDIKIFSSCKAYKEIKMKAWKSGANLYIAISEYLYNRCIIKSLPMDNG